MSKNQEQDFIELITEYAKSTDQHVDLDDVREAFPEFYPETPVYKKKEEDALFDQPVFVADLEEVQNAQDIEKIQAEVGELRKLIATHSELLSEIKKDVKTNTPAVDEALLKQRLETFQQMHDRLEKRIEQNEKEILISKENDTALAKKRNTWWMPLFLLLNIILFALLLYLLFGKFNNTNQDNAITSSAQVDAQNIVKPNADNELQKTIAPNTIAEPIEVNDAKNILAPKGIGLIAPLWNEPLAQVKERIELEAIKVAETQKALLQKNAEQKKITLAKATEAKALAEQIELAQVAKEETAATLEKKTKSPIIKQTKRTKASKANTPKATVKTKPINIETTPKAAPYVAPAAKQPAVIFK